MPTIKGYPHQAREAPCPFRAIHVVGTARTLEWQCRGRARLLQHTGLPVLFGTSKGLLVVHAPDDAKLQLKDGDVILDIGGREPTSPEHAMRILGSFQKGEPLKITIMRNKGKQTLDVKLPA